MSTNVRICKAKRKDDNGNLLTCGAPMKGSCPKRSEHVMKMKTGTCSDGFHEGSKARDASGTPASVCQHWKTCPCECHTELDQLFVMTHSTRVPQENPEYVSPKSPYWMPTLEERALMHAASRLEHGAEPEVIESPIPEAIPATIQRSFIETPSGRAGRGQLEYWVKEACDEWIVEQYKNLCSPSWVAAWVEKNKAISNQSAGAVDAVFKRWVRIGFAKIEFKPTRFLGYTDEGVRLGLDAMKIKAKSEQKRKQTRAMQGAR